MSGVKGNKKSIAKSSDSAVLRKKSVERMINEIKKGEQSGISDISHEDFWKGYGL